MTLVTISMSNYILQPHILPIYLNFRATLPLWIRWDAPSHTILFRGQSLLGTNLLY